MTDSYYIIRFRAI